MFFWNLFYDIYLFVYASKYPESSKFRGSTAVLRSILWFYKGKISKYSLLLVVLPRNLLDPINLILDYSNNWIMEIYTIKCSSFWSKLSLYKHLRTRQTFSGRSWGIWFFLWISTIAQNIGIKEVELGLAVNWLVYLV